MSGDEIRRREAARWLAIVAEDVRVAFACLRMDDPAPGSAAYHCQQAAEKVLKGLLVVADTTFGRTHDLDELVDLALRHYPDESASLEAVRGLTVWGIAYRYPGLEDVPEPVPDDQEITGALAAISLLSQVLRRLIGMHSDPSTGEK